LEKFANVKSGLLSSGEGSRLSLAKARLNDPCLMLLDEPTASLDPDISRTVRSSIKRYVEEKNASVLWTSHNMREIESVCDRVMFLSHGKVVLSGDPKTLAAEHNQKDLEELFIKIAREPINS
jgi:ABC-2 type transport system ATP-binding protein